MAMNQVDPCDEIREKLRAARNEYEKQLSDPLNLREDHPEQYKAELRRRAEKVKRLERELEECQEKHLSRSQGA